MLIFFTDFGFMEFQVRYLVVYLLLSIIDGFGCFCMGSINKNVQLMLEFLKAPVLVLHSLYCTLVTYADNTIHFKYDQVSDLWQGL